MEKWSIPIALLPGIALLILSTSNFILGLHRELKEIGQEQTEKNLIKAKLSQLKILSLALTGLYASSVFLVLISVMMLYDAGQTRMDLPLISKGLHLLSVASIFFSLSLLTLYATRAVRFRQSSFRQLFQKPDAP